MNSPAADSGTFGQTSFGKTIGSNLRSVQYFIHDHWEASLKWITYLASLAAIAAFCIFSQQCNETNGGETAMLITALIVAGLTIVALLLAVMGGCVMDDFSWSYQGLVLVPALGMAMIAGRIHPTSQSRYVKLIDGKPVLAGETSWVYPWQFGRVVLIPKQQHVHLWNLPARTSDGQDIVGHLHFAGRLSENPDTWIDFENGRKSFISKLEEAYVATVTGSSLADLEKPLLISSRMESAARGIFTGSAIIPDQMGTIEAEGFEIVVHDQKSPK